MINRSKQNWTEGQTVQVGFMSLIVKKAISTPGDGLPDAYILTNVAGTQLYEFVPHNGLRKLDVEDAKLMIERDNQRVIQSMKASAAKVELQNQIAAVFA